MLAITPRNAVEETPDQRTKRQIRNRISCDLLLAKLFTKHPEHAAAMLRGIEPKVVDLEPPEYVPPIDEPAPVSNVIAFTPVSAEDSPPAALIIRETARFYKFTTQEMLARRREKDDVHARQIAMYLLKRLTTLSFPEIGRWMGMDHTTAIHSYKKIKTAVAASPRLTDEIEVLRLRIAQAMLVA